MASWSRPDAPEPVMTERELFVAALHLRDAARIAFLDQACGTDRALRERVTEAEAATAEAVVERTPGP